MAGGLPGFGNTRVVLKPGNAEKKAQHPLPSDSAILQGQGSRKSLNYRLRTGRAPRAASPNSSVPDRRPQRPRKAGGQGPTRAPSRRSRGRGAVAPLLRDTRRLQNRGQDAPQPRSCPPTRPSHKPLRKQEENLWLAALQHPNGLDRAIYSYVPQHGPFCEGQRARQGLPGAPELRSVPGAAPLLHPGKNKPLRPQRRAHCSARSARGPGHGAVTPARRAGRSPAHAKAMRARSCGGTGAQRPFPRTGGPGGNPAGRAAPARGGKVAAFSAPSPEAPDPPPGAPPARAQPPALREQPAGGTAPARALAGALHSSRGSRPPRGRPHHRGAPPTCSFQPRAAFPSAGTGTGTGGGAFKEPHGRRAPLRAPLPPRAGSRRTRFAARAPLRPLLVRLQAP